MLVVTAMVVTFSSLFFWVLGLDYPVLTGIASGVLNMVPYIGAVLAWLPKLQLAECVQREQKRVIEAVIGWLRAHQRWLLVVDNLDDVAAPSLNRLLGAAPGRFW